MEGYHSNNILLAIIIFIIINKISPVQYPNAMALTNFNILIIDKNGIYIYDPSLSYKINDVYEFEEDDKIIDAKNYFNVIMRERDNYIFCMVNFKLFFLSNEGNLIESTERLIEENPSDFALVPFSCDFGFYFIFGYIEKSNNIFHLNMYFSDGIKDDKQPSCLFEEYTEDLEGYMEENVGLSCEYLLNNGEYYLICFININNKITQFVYTIKDFQQFSKYNGEIGANFNYDLNNISSIKSISNRELDKACFAFIYEKCDTLRIIIFYYDSNGFIEINFFDSFQIDLKYEYVGHKLEYILEKDLIIFSFIDFGFHYIALPGEASSVIEKLMNFNPNYGYSIIYSALYEDFCIISNLDGSEEVISIIPLDYEFPIIVPNEEKEKTEKEKTEKIGGIKEVEEKEEEDEKNKEKNTESYKSEIIEKEEKKEKKETIEIEGKKEEIEKEKEIKKEIEEKKEATENKEKETEKKEKEEKKGKEEEEKNETCEKDKESELEEKIEIKEKEKEKIKEETSRKENEEGNNLDKNVEIILNNVNNTSNDDDIISSFQDFITNEIDLGSIEEGKDIIINTEQGNTITFTSTENQKSELNKNKTTINLGECEESLRNYYNISYNDSLYILKIDIEQKGMNIPKLEYEVYSKLKGDKMVKLNMTVCKDKKIEISIPVSINDDIEKYNISSNYYNDVCNVASSERGTDISLKDRKNNFLNNNLTLCEENCDLMDYDYKYEKAICSCDIKEEITGSIIDIKIDKEKLKHNFKDIKGNFANLKILKCYQNVFDLKSLKNNYGFIIIISVSILFFICMILFLCKYYYSLRKEVETITDAIKTIRNKDNNVNDTIGDKKTKKIKKLKNKKQKRIKEDKDNEENIKNKLHNNPIKKKSKRKSIISMNKSEKNNVTNILHIHNNKKKHRRKSYKLNKNQRLNNNYIKKQKNKINNRFLNRVDNINNNININNNELTIMNLNDNEMNSLPYEEAIKIDKRTFCEFYFSLFRTNHILVFSFYTKNDHNSRIIKIFLFFFSFIIHFTVNALFFNDSTMHQIYVDEGTFNFIYNLPQIIYSAIISGAIRALINFLALSEKNIIALKRIKKIENLDNSVKELFLTLKIKFTFYFIISFIILTAFGYYIISFCGIYINTQIHLIKDTVFSFITSLIYPFGLYLLPAIFRIIALGDRKGNRKVCFIFYKILQFL